jgi:histidine triad (HIT) family protein
MKDCVFCKIVKGEIPAYMIAEDDKFLAFLDMTQFTKGHTLVIPKDHYHFIWDVPNIDEYFEFVQKVGNHFREMGYKYVDTLTMGRQVPHSHVHVVPHNGGENDWKEALGGVFHLQTDEQRRPDDSTMKTIQKQFEMN